MSKAISIWTVSDLNQWFCASAIYRNTNIIRANEKWRWNKRERCRFRSHSILPKPKLSVSISINCNPTNHSIRFKLTRSHWSPTWETIRSTLHAMTSISIAFTTRTQAHNIRRNKFLHSNANKSAKRAKKNDKNKTSDDERTRKAQKKDAFCIVTVIVGIVVVALETHQYPFYCSAMWTWKINLSSVP